MILKHLAQPAPSTDLQVELGYRTVQTAPLGVIASNRVYHHLLATAQPDSIARQTRLPSTRTHARSVTNVLKAVLSRRFVKTRLIPTLSDNQYALNVQLDITVSTVELLNVYQETIAQRVCPKEFRVHPELFQMKPVYKKLQVVNFARKASFVLVVKRVTPVIAR